MKTWKKFEIIGELIMACICISHSVINAALLFFFLGVLLLCFCLLDGHDYYSSRWDE